MAVTVVTSFHPAGYEQYGRGFLEGFNKYWPDSVRLVVYTELPIDLERGENRSLWSIPGVGAFMSRNAGIPAYCGQGRSITEQRWSDKEKAAKYSYRFDAVKFFKMAVAPYQTAVDIMSDDAYVENDILVWLDGDVMTYKPIPEGFIEDLLGDADIAFLGRETKHSETGFIAFRIPAAIPVLWSYSNLFLSDNVFMLPEWHSAYVFDHARKLHSVKERNLSPGGKGHVWFQSRLGAYMDHLKGKRKEIGRSRERPE